MSRKVVTSACSHHDFILGTALLGVRTATTTPRVRQARDLVSAARAMTTFAAAAASRAPAARPATDATRRSHQSMTWRSGAFSRAAAAPTRTVASASRASTKAPPVAPAPFTPPAAGAWCDPRRVRVLRGGPNPVGDGPVVYWMSRERRVMDNWALAHALAVAARARKPFHVLYVLDHEQDAFAGARHRLFELEGLRETQERLRALGVPFHLFDARDTADDAEMGGASVSAALEHLAPSFVVTDFSPLRPAREARDTVALLLCPCDVPVHEVDARNVVPVWEASDKREYAARTIRKKITNRLPEFLTEFPNERAIRESVEACDVGIGISDVRSASSISFSPSDRTDADRQQSEHIHTQPSPIDWDALLSRARRSGGAPEVISAARRVTPGETAARRRLFSFCENLHLYAHRNDPNVLGAPSGLSPYVRFGHISAQRAALEAEKASASRKTENDADRVTAEACASFLEELIVRRELAENFCLYTPEYDTLRGVAPGWALESLELHAGDVRDPAYTADELEHARTHDELWNAAQTELTTLGAMHGFMRMYWCKKILEWTEGGPHEAFQIALRLNDAYALDGRDCNGFVGVAWSIGGVHDQGWKERSVFGKVRYMNYAGCKRKFKIDEYVRRIENEAFAERSAREDFSESNASS
jgi:deoxyribodipyrimidine photo-lyase